MLSVPLSSNSLECFTPWFTPCFTPTDNALQFADVSSHLSKSSLERRENLSLSLCNFSVTVVGTRVKRPQHNMRTMKGRREREREREREKDKDESSTVIFSLPNFLISFLSFFSSWEGPLGLLGTPSPLVRPAYSFHDIEIPLVIYHTHKQAICTDVQNACLRPCGLLEAQDEKALPSAHTCTLQMKATRERGCLESLEREEKRKLEEGNKPVAKGPRASSPAN